MIFKFSVILIGLGVSLYVVRRYVTEPLLSIKNVMNRLNDGERDVVIAEVQNQDEIGDMARAIENFRLSLIESDKITLEKQESVEQETERARKMLAILDDFERHIGSIISSSKDASHNVEEAVQKMIGIADETNNQSMMVASAAEQTSMNVQTVASATEEMSASIQEISR